MYVKETLRLRQSSTMDANQFDESVCDVQFILPIPQVGVCYQSPSSSDDNNDKLVDLLHMAVEESRGSQLLLMGD